MSKIYNFKTVFSDILEYQQYKRFVLKAYAITGQEVLHFSKEVLTQLMVDSATLALRHT